MLIILVLFSWRRNSFAKDAMLRNSYLYFIGMSFCAAIAAPKLPLNTASILILLTAASFVLLNKKMGLSIFLIGVFSITLIVITSHDGLVNC